MDDVPRGGRSESNENASGKERKLRLGWGRWGGGCDASAFIHMNVCTSVV